MIIFEKEKRIDLIIKDFFLVFNYNPFIIDFINTNEINKIKDSDFFKDIKILTKAISSFNYFFKNQINKAEIKKSKIDKINKSLIFISFLLAYNELINIKIIDIEKFKNIISNKKQLEILEKNWILIFKYTKEKINSKTIKKIVKHLVETENFNNIEIFILLLFLIIKTKSNNKYLIKKIFKRKYVNKLFITGEFLISIAKYYYNLNLKTSILKELIKKINYLYYVSKLNTINQVIRYTKNYIKKKLQINKIE